MSVILNDYHLVQFPSSETSNYEKDSVAQVKQICQSVFEFVGKSVGFPLKKLTILTTALPR